MDDLQKEGIRIYRYLGIGYKRIARDLWLPVGTIRKWCRKNGMGGVAVNAADNAAAWADKNGRCLYCGRKLKPSGRGRPRKFCSGKCRTAYFRLRKEKEQGYEYY